MEFDNLQELIHLLDRADGVTEITVSGSDGAKITVKRSASRLQPSAPATSTALAPSPHNLLVTSQGEQIMDLDYDEDIDTPRKRLHSTVSANRVGIFHQSKPGVGQGDRVDVGQIVGYIESIKLMNEIRSEYGGEIVDMLVEAGTPVEYGQALFRVSAIEV